ncbi:hypothetical protein GALMADRAFT_246249 [Galerina marginata CBS 339.88]|uniref:Peptidase C14 caspase domain-containing protein n=1 Tax=Galerina marginata (strain CBS 339.88) TaxID=685588 RepID=A0A067T417_GALM3|nr:hypothetical protein GALMADRAFT_246249 [Galerina marginata CBS 339.88]
MVSKSQSASPSQMLQPEVACSLSQEPSLSESTLPVPHQHQPSLSPRVSKADVLGTDLAKSSFFALVIGINNYLHCGSYICNLKGAISDAEDVLDVLTQKFHVPDEHISKLFNNEATRDNIMSHIQALAEDERIAFGDAILIYYAGHGSEAEAPRIGSLADKIQLLLPYDFDPQNSLDRHLQGIPDFTVAAMLTNLANAKGNNITVIFDSCHSGSGTRHSNSSAEVVRGVDLPPGYKISLSLYEEVLGNSRLATISKFDQNTGLASHVLLAACSKDELAYEERHRGRFTKALTALLREGPIDNITYRQVIEMLKVDGQTPQCESIHDNRIIFTNKSPNRVPMLFPLKFDRATVLLQAGQVQGVVNGSLFSIFSTEDMSSGPLGSLVAHDVRPLSTIMHRLSDAAIFRIPSPAWALQTHTGDGAKVNILIPAEEDFLPVIQSIREAGNRTMIRLVEDQSHEIAVVQTGGGASFVLIDKICCENNIRCLPFSASLDTDEIFSILSHAALFFWDLRRLGKRSTPLVSLEAYQIIVDASLDPLHAGSIFKTVGDNLNDGKVIKVSLRGGAETKYGFKLKNPGSQPLYVWLFSFNMANLSVGILYKPNIRDPSLPPGGELTIGYGSGGARPLSFQRHQGLDVEVTYLTAVFTPTFVDLSHLERYEVAKSTGRAVAISKRPEHPMWGTLQIPIIYVWMNDPGKPN